MENFSHQGVSEINLHQVISKIWKYKFLFLLCVIASVGLTYAYTKVAVPCYRVSSSLLVNDKGDQRNLSSSEYVQGGVGMIGTEKNLFNEIGVLQSFSLIEEAVGELDFEVSYFAANWYKKREYYNYFPIVVELLDSTNQTYELDFHVEILDDRKFRLHFEDKDFYVFDPVANSSIPIEQEFIFSEVFEFGQKIEHERFNFIIHKSDKVKGIQGFEEKELYFNVHNQHDIARHYKGILEVIKTDVQASILRLNTEGTVPKKEIIFLNKLAEKYIEQGLNNRKTIAQNKQDFIQNQLTGIRDSLGRAEQSLANFKTGSSSIDIKRTTTNTLDLLQSLETEKRQMQSNTDYYLSLLKYIGEESSINKIMAPSVVGIEDPLLNENLLDLKRLNAERNKIKFYKGKKSYDLEMIEGQILNTSIALQENIKNLMNSTKVKAGEKNNRIAELEQKIDRLPANEKRLANYERKSQFYDNMYKYLSQELAKAEIATADHMPDVKVLDQPRVEGSGPFAPNKALLLPLALLLGIFIPTVFIMIGDGFSRTVMSASDIESRTNTPVIASIAHHKLKGKLLESNDLSWQLEESFNDLSAKLNFLIPNPGQNIIGFTSILPDEGKSFCASLLAVNLAKAGKKVALIDLDFRNPSISKEINQLNRHSLVEYLNDPQIGMDAIVCTHHKYKSLDIIPATVYENSMLLLNSPQLEDLLKELRGKYDYVILDAPAVGLVSDYLLVSKYVDIHLAVLRRKVSKFGFIKNLNRLKDEGQLKNMFFILNDVKASELKYGYASPYTNNTNKQTDNIKPITGPVKA